MKTELEFLGELSDFGDGIIPCDRDCDCNKLREKIERFGAIKRKMIIGKIKLNFARGNYTIVKSITEIKEYDNVVSMEYLN